MEYEKWGPTTYLFWAALMVVVWAPSLTVAANVVLVTFGLSLAWQGVQWILIRRQRKAKAEELLTVS